VAVSHTKCKRPSIIVTSNVPASYYRLRGTEDEAIKQ